MMRLSAIALVIVGALAIAGCGGDDDASSQPAATSSQSDSQEPTSPSGGEGPPPVSAQPTVQASGLQIIEIKVGDGQEVELGATVTVHYTGWLADGTVFDSSVDDGEPVSFSLADVIQGWQDGIPGMKVGGKRRLIIPSELAYGEAGRPPVIPANSELTFDVELLDIP